MPKPGKIRGGWSAHIAATVAVLITAAAAASAASAATPHRAAHDVTFWPGPGRATGPTTRSRDR